MAHHPVPVSYSPSLEVIGPDERETQRELIETIRKIQETTYEDYGFPVRGVHAKAHGLLTGWLEVSTGLPDSLAQGIFAEPRRYDVVMRYSTNPGDLLDDSVTTPRGLALKVRGVPGSRLPDAIGDAQDFVLANGPAFQAKDAAAFLKSLRLLASTTDTPQVLKKAVSATMRGLEAVLETVGTKSPTVIGLGGQPFTHILGDTFYSQVPMRWGKYVAKVAIVPSSPELIALQNAHLELSGPDALRDAVTAFFAGQGGEWEFRAQLLTDPEIMPIEDASVPWPEDQSPYVTVGRIRVPPQASWSGAKAQELDEGLAFNPWIGVADHQPLGSVMRARQAVYPASVAFRSEHGRCPVRAA